ncbi:hypothetical protein E2562_005318 [Oryza meyeriana var. granulata]|uniref:Uncharacterized protein n=1 Tax=Oryza meyeriana var. granulata TaxID=110450 RepID=A0A6G1DET2_9ORYZ|nr:hypothetical protein E2562_005318 [Oryza meyeriana var. granulata]
MSSPSSPPGFRQAAPSPAAPRRAACTSPLRCRPSRAVAASSSPCTSAPAPFVRRATPCHEAHDARASRRRAPGRGRLGAKQRTPRSTVDSMHRALSRLPFYTAVSRPILRRHAPVPVTATAQEGPKDEPHTACNRRRLSCLLCVTRVLSQDSLARQPQGAEDGAHVAIDGAATPAPRLSASRREKSRARRL